MRFAIFFSMLTVARFINPEFWNEWVEYENRSFVVAAFSIVFLIMDIAEFYKRMTE